MALNDDAVMKPSGGHFYTAPVGTTFPADLLSPGVDWDEIGHTSLDSILSFSSEGGEATSLGTLQAPTMKLSYSTRTEAIGFNLQQWDADSIKLYFGSNMVDVDSENPGQWLGVHSSPTPTERAFLVVINDGAERAFGLWAPKANLFRGDDASIDDMESLASLPITVTPLVNSGNLFTYAITPLQEVA